MSAKNPYEKVIKKFLVLLGLLILSPLVFSIATKAQRIYTEGIKVYVSYLLLVIGIALLIFTVYFGFKTFKTLIDTIFKNE